jgi:microtubule-associated protein-like 6
MQSNCGAYELLFSETNKGQQITSASSLRDTQWDTFTCTLGWPVQGIWPKVGPRARVRRFFVVWHCCQL